MSAFCVHSRSDLIPNRPKADTEQTKKEQRKMTPILKADNRSLHTNDKISLHVYLEYTRVGLTSSTKTDGSASLLRA